MDFLRINDVNGVRLTFYVSMMLMEYDGLFTNKTMVYGWNPRDAD